MRTTWTCPVCGSREKRFSREKRCEVCRQCGHEVMTDAEYNANIAYEKTVLLAMDHLQVGHWDAVRKLIEPLCANRPAEKKLYLMLLMAVTKGYADYLLDDDRSCRDAERYWDHLARLHCINGAMTDYARRRNDVINSRLAAYEGKKALILIASLMSSLLALCTIAGGGSMGVLFLFLAIAGWVWFFKVKKPHNLRVPGSTDNPFR